jgi:diguanylate cyclase (GGDEF)-like protein
MSHRRLLPTPTDLTAPPGRWRWVLLATIVGCTAIALLSALHEREQTARRAETQATLFATGLRDSVRELTVFAQTIPQRDLAPALRPVIAATAASAAQRIDRLDAVLGRDARTQRLRAQLQEIRMLAASSGGPTAFSPQITATTDALARNADAIARTEHARATLIAREGMAGSALVILLALGLVVFVLLRAQRLLHAAGQRQAAELQRLADGDPLTGLANRRRLAEDLEQLAPQVSASAPVQVLICDLDDFKGLNDRLGHEAGDQLLIDVAQRLRDAAGTDGSAYRLGGDEFCVVSHPGRDVAGSVRDALVGRGPDPVHGSAGLALWPTEAPSARAAMRLADERMYTVKDDARGTAIATPLNARP